MIDARAAARAIDALRRGWPVAIGGGGSTIEVLAIESADDLRLAAFDPAATADVLISHERAATLKLANQRDAATPSLPVLVARAPWLDLPAAFALADPSGDLAHPLQGPYRTAPVEAPAAAGAALSLARLAGLLPAFFIRPSDRIAEVSAGDVAAFAAPDDLAIVARARLPVTVAEQAEIVAFRGAADAGEHVALVIGQPDGTPPLVRLHSECLTGDALGSLKCDCGPQLDEALRTIAKSGWGILLYLRQEGRGIGLVNKLRAYALQDQGFDTVDANLRLGFAIDMREFAIAARMLHLLAQHRVRLLTNNPAKVKGLEGAGIEVVERLPLAIASNVHNARYLDVKRLRDWAPAVKLCVDVAERLLHFDNRSIRCSIGCGGTCPAALKREGDGATPVGAWPLRGVLLRPDRVALADTLELPWRWLRPDDGWSDDVADPAYNRPVRHPHAHHAERLWRDDALYDLIVVLGHNDGPPIAGAGSAIFLHVWNDGAPTEGCVAIAREALLALLPSLRPGDVLEIV